MEEYIRLKTSGEIMKRSLIFLGIFLVFSLFSVNAQSSLSNTVCCEKTNSGAFCQDVPSSECAPGYRQVPSSCESTSFCAAGTCYDSGEGTCLDNTAQLVCNQNGGTWSEEEPPQCSLGCCILGDQGAFVSLVRCKKLSSSLGLETNYDSSIQSEAACIAEVTSQEKGACVFEFEFERTCKFTTNAECSGKTENLNGTISEGSFFPGILCSAEELGTNCGPSTQTTCLPGKDGVYFVDTCGNPANIYDSSKVNDAEYWTNIKDSLESCDSSSSNAESRSCGNCNYLLGSYCRNEEVANANPTYGDYICADLNCKDEEGKARYHGESWCVNDPGFDQDGKNTVGSRSFKHICINGEVVAEACEDFRAETCIEDKIETTLGDFSQAACRVNRWQDCLAQEDQNACENSDRRDCFWEEGVKIGDAGIGGTCLPENSPGLDFWSSQETRTVCSQGNTVCVVKFEKGLFGGEECVDNCECLDENWVDQHANVCMALGDCGPGTNWIGQEGADEGFKKRISDSLKRFEKETGQTTEAG